MASQSECAIVHKTIENLENLGKLIEKSGILIMGTGKSGKFKLSDELSIPAVERYVYSECSAICITSQQCSKELF